MNSFLEERNLQPVRGHFAARMWSGRLLQVEAEEYLKAPSFVQCEKQIQERERLYRRSGVSFAGGTQKPHCKACVMATTPVGVVEARPWPSDVHPLGLSSTSSRDLHWSCRNQVVSARSFASQCGGGLRSRTAGPMSCHLPK